MNEMMTFPDTWEDFERSYGFTDNEEVYTNGARLIPSFRVKQWLDHLPSVQPEVANNSPKLDKEIGECNDCIKHGGDWECDRVHCHKGDVPDTNVGELINRQMAIDELLNLDVTHRVSWRDAVIDMIDAMPSVQPELSSNSQELDNKNGELISRQEAVDEIEEWIIAFRVNGHKESAADACLIRDGIIQLPSVPRKGKWIDYSDEGFVECPFCHSATNCDGNKDELHYCFSCGAELR